MGDVEGTFDSHRDNSHNANPRRDIHEGKELPAQPENRQYDIPENWADINIEIRQRNKPPKLARSAKFTRSNITIASQNINGREQGKSMTHEKHKFTDMKMVDKHHIGVFGLQETHMDTVALTQFNNIYGKWFKMFNSGHPIKPHSTAGVGFLLNKKYVDTENVKEYTLVEGHAIMLCIPSHRGETVNILNIYAPNTPAERNKMWAQIWHCYLNDASLPLPTEILGDWNFVEDTKDRTSNKDETVPLSFECLKALFRMQDGWRTTFPDAKEYTCFQKRRSVSTNKIHVSGSRIDRIYVPINRFKRYRDWTIQPSLINSDHSFISVQLTCRPDEQHGPGIWNFPIYLLKTPRFIKYLNVRSKSLEKDLELLKCSGRQNTNNIQTLWQTYKDDLTAEGKICSRLVSERSRQIRTWTTQKYLVINDNDLPTEEKYLQIVHLEEKIEAYLKEEASRKKEQSEARYDIEGESLKTGHWTRSTKDYNIRNTINEFKITDTAPPRFETRPKQMSEMARNYHDSVQRADVSDGDEYGRILCTEEVLTQCDAKLSKDEYSEMDKDLTEEDIRNALKLSSNGKVPGVNGIRYEFFKLMDIEYRKSKDKPGGAFNILGFLAK
ncbi:Endonuclease/exonuclease/phosphatase, partial [Mycena vitilis]